MRIQRSTLMVTACRVMVSKRPKSVVVLTYTSSSSTSIYFFTRAGSSTPIPRALCSPYRLLYHCCGALTSHSALLPVELFDPATPIFVQSMCSNLSMACACDQNSMLPPLPASKMSNGFSSPENPTTSGWSFS